MAEDQSYATINPDAVPEIFYADCPAEDVARAKALLVPEPVAPLATPVGTTRANFGRIPRVYIECLRDKAVSPTIQRQMYSASPCQQLLTLDTSHSPFFSAPEQLVAHLAALDSRAAGQAAEAGTLS